MDQPQPVLPRQRNLYTQSRHRREVFWQVTIPVIAGILMCLLLSLLAVGTTSPQTEKWADISTIWLIIPAIIMSLIFSALLGAVIYLSVILIREIPFYAYKAYCWILGVNVQISKIGNAAVEPFLRVRSTSASMRALGRQIRRK